MTKREFDILVALEGGKVLPEDPKTLANLTEAGLVCDGAITHKGLAALAPHKTKRVIFLAAGMGSRLHPVTLKTPKPLVKVKGVRIIDTLIDGAMAAGIAEIIVVCGYLGEEFVQLKEKYPHIKLVTNPIYDKANNIASVHLVREHLQNTYIAEADLLLHKQVFDKYLFRSCYLGIPTAQTDDWYFKTNQQGVICQLGIGGENCYRMLGISYWNSEDGARLPAHIDATFKMPGGKDQDWCYVPLVSFKDAYKVYVRECAMDDIEEIDTYEELCAIDPSYCEEESF